MLGKLNLESTVLLKRRHTAKILTTGFPSINTQKKRIQEKFYVNSMCVVFSLFMPVILLYKTS